MGESSGEEIESSVIRSAMAAVVVIGALERGRGLREGRGGGGVLLRSSGVLL